jgi:hypothetical protein
VKVRSVTAGMLALLLAPVVYTGPARAATPTLTASFNRPTVAGAEDNTMLTRLTALVDAAATGSTIRVSLPTLSDQQLTDRLLAAQNQRQVTVLAVAEQCATKDSTGTCAIPPIALTALANGMTAGRFTWCREGCLTASGAVVGAGYWLFDALTDGRRDVVAQTSADPSANAARAHHDMVVVADDSALAAGYRTYFAAQAAGSPATFTGSVRGSDGRTEVFFGPRPATQPDPLVGLVNDVKCPGGTIRVASRAWGANRTGLLNLLAAKKAAGCAVEVVVTDRNDALPVLGHANVDVYTFRPGGCRYPANGSCDTGGLGSTFVLTSGVSQSTGATANLVFTGPRSLTDQQLRGDDSVLLKLNDPAVYQAYDTQWQRLRDEALRILPETWPNAAKSTVNSTATGDQDASAIATNRNGYLAVAWEDDRDSTAPDDPIHSEVFLRLFKDGVSQYEMKLSGGGSGNWRHAQPDVALDDAGNAAVAWAIDGDGNGYFDISIAVVRPSGTVVGTARANASSTGQQIEPAVAIDPDTGGFAVAWEDIQSGAPATVRVAGFTSLTSKTYETQVNGATAAAGGNHRPDVAVSGAGNATVVWDEDGDGNGSFNVGLRVLTSTGSTKLAQSIANADVAGQQRHPSVATNLNGDAVVAWEDDRTGAPRLYARMFSPAGAAQTADIPVAPDAAGAGDPIGAQSMPQAGIDDQRNVVVAWTEAGYSGPDVWVRGLNPDGTTAGRLPAVRLNMNTVDRQEEAALAVSAWDEVHLAYTDDADGNGFDQVQLRTGFANAIW